MVAGSRLELAAGLPIAAVAVRVRGELIRRWRSCSVLGIGTIEIYAATAADGLTRFHDAAHFLERQVGFLAVGGFAMFAEELRTRAPDAQIRFVGTQRGITHPREPGW